MFYIRDRETKRLLRGMGMGKARHGMGMPVWGDKRDTQWAKVFNSIEGAKRWVKKYHMRDVEILNVVLTPVWREGDEGDAR